jgi:hypothetical protein
MVVFRTEMERVAGAIAEGRTLADRHGGRMAIPWVRENPKSWNEYPDLGSAGTLLSFDILFRAQAGDLEGALHSIRARLAIIAAIGIAPTPGAQWARSQASAGLVRELEHTLALGEPPSGALELIQQQVQEEAEYPLLLTAARGRRALMDQFCELLLSGQVPIGDWLKPSQRKKDDEPDDAAIDEKAAITLARGVLLEQMNEQVERLKLPFVKQVDPALVRKKPAEDDPPLVHKLMFESRVWDSPNMQARLRCTATSIAVERYRQKHQRWPQQLADLVPDFLAAVPSDPFTDAPLRYQRLEDGVVIYSIGRDREDGGGFLKREGVLKDPDDVGFQLWDVAKRRQPAK